MTQTLSRAYVAFGSNLPSEAGNSGDLIRAAVLRLGEMGQVRSSPLYASPAYPVGSGPDFVNGVAELATTLVAQDLLDALHRIEAGFGRTRDTRWGPRVLDLDLLAVGDAVMPDAKTQDDWRKLPPKRQMQLAPDRLILPHPRLQDRAFVLVPWADIAPGWKHPRTGWTVAQMLAALPATDVAAIRPLKGC